MSKTKVKPLGDRILVKPAKAVEKIGSIHLPEQAQEKSLEAMVVELGTGSTNEAGIKKTFDVKVGEKVLISKFGGTEITIGGEEFRLVHSDDIMGKFEN